MIARLFSSANPSKRLGIRGERLARKTLRTQGYKILATNARVPMGEADIVCCAPDGCTIVIVEVKCRLLDPAHPTPPPEANVHAHKRDKLRAIAKHLVRANNWHDRPIRIDVIAVDWPTHGRPTLRHIEHAVSDR